MKLGSMEHFVDTLNIEGIALNILYHPFLKLSFEINDGVFECPHMQKRVGLRDSAFAESVVCTESVVEEMPGTRLTRLWLMHEIS